MYHNGWRGDHSEADSSPLVPNMYPQGNSDQNIYHHPEQNQQHPGLHYTQTHQQHYPPVNQHLHPNPTLLHNPPPLFHHHSAPQPVPHIDLSSTLAQLAAGQQELFESLRNLSGRMDLANRQAQPTVDQIASDLGGINLDRQNPPHLSRPQPSNQHNLNARIPNLSSRISSPSEGHYARDPSRLIH